MGDSNKPTHLSLLFLFFLNLDWLAQLAKLTI